MNQTKGWCASVYSNKLLAKVRNACGIALVLIGLLAGCVTQTPAAGSPAPASVTPPAATATTADLPPASTPAPRCASCGRSGNTRARFL
ncbi:hypothetical protein [Candidatus Amarolinea dominans]|uniref:hypothetical protein n=1 Tax=Candidatus Amarolinea dominans TaxID=3140696 RepID=UPI0031356481|nr:hypothetical protein [Anaerolineae bacterium]